MLNLKSGNISDPGTNRQDYDDEAHLFDKPKKEKLQGRKRFKTYFDFYQANKGGFGGQDSSDLVDLEPDHNASITV